MKRLLELRQGLLSEFQFENRDLSHLDLNGLVVAAPTSMVRT